MGQSDTHIGQKNGRAESRICTVQNDAARICVLFVQK